MTDYKPVTESEMEEFKETLKRCPEGTLESLLLYRENKSAEALNVFLIGCIKRHADEEYHEVLDTGGKEVSFIDDLGIDSMTMMEIVMMVELCLDIQIENQDLMTIRTLGDLDAYLQKNL